MQFLFLISALAVLLTPLPIFAEENLLTNNSTQLQFDLINNNTEKIQNDLNEIKINLFKLEEKIDSTVIKNSEIQSQNFELSQKIDQLDTTVVEFQENHVLEHPKLIDFSNESDENEYYDIIEKFVMVLVPTLIGGIATAKIASSWQKTKHRYELKKHILQEFDNSFILAHNSLSKFDFILFSKYFKTDKSTIINDDLGYDNPIITIDPEDYPPRTRYSELYDEYVKAFSEAMSNVWKFDSILQLHYQNHDLNHEFLSTSAEIERTRFRLTRTFDSIDNEEFTSNHDEFFKQAKILESKIVDFRKNILDTKLEKSILK